MPTDISFSLQSSIHEAVDELMLCKLSKIPSQHNLQNLVHSFIDAERAKVFVLVVNMQEFKQKELVNHIRIIIEEEEQKCIRRQKLFILLLHFPPSKLRNGSYPSLFLHGWDHYYLDTIAHNVETGLDIERWLEYCCFPLDTQLQTAEDPLTHTIKRILEEEALPIIVARVNFGLAKDGCFNTKISVPERTVKLKILLNDKGVGDVLCKMFRSYWIPEVISQYLDDAAVLTKTNDSTLSVTDYIHTTFKGLFFDFLVYMITRINHDGNIDVLFVPNTPRPIVKLFLDIMQNLSIPELSELKLRSIHYQLECNITCVPQFPFHKIVSNEMARVVESSRKEMNIKINLLGDLEDKAADPTMSFSKRKFLVETILRKLQEMVCNFAYTHCSLGFAISINVAHPPFHSIVKDSPFVALNH